MNGRVPGSNLNRSQWQEHGVVPVTVLMSTKISTCAAILWYQTGWRSARSGMRPMTQTSSISGPTTSFEVRHDVLTGADGPMLRHGLQEMRGAQIVLPRSRRDRPDPTRLEEHYARFRAAA